MKKFPIVAFPIIQEILDKSESFLDSIVSKIEAEYIKDGNRVFTDYKRELEYLKLVFDLVKSLSNKLDKNDILKDLNVKYSVGKLEIDATIERNGKDYNLSTESIYAGGYNIQQLHIRYITKTNLPSVDNSELLKTIKDKIKKLTNVEILRKDILRLENNIVKSEKKLEALTNMSEEDVLNNSDYKKYVNQGLDTSRYSGDDMPGNIHKNQETYDAFLNDVKTYELKRHYSSIEMCKKDIINTKKNIVLIQKKLDKLL